jgi:UDP-N-acetyl-D-mannosaminouronate:lipid I N-acetyl-D-mannosaminouronosyltransferase
MNKIPLNGVVTYSFPSRDELIKYVCNEKKSLVAVNAEKILHATNQTRSLINKNIGYSDGIGAVWALKKKGFKNTIKIPGCELWLDIVNALFEEKTFYLIGSKQEVIEETVNKLHSEFPKIRILNFRNGYIKTDEDKQVLIADIKDKKPDVVFVAMGSPKQELLIQEMQDIHSAIYQGLGGSFDVYTGHVQRAPEWWIKNNLEWAYRLFKQPSRLLRQIHLLKFLWLLLLNRI